MRPSKPGKIIHERLRKKAFLTVFEKGGGPVSLAQPGPVLAMDQGHMAELRHIEAKGPVHEDLAGRVIDMVVSPDDMGDTHKGVIDDDREIVRGRTVIAEHDKI